MTNLNELGIFILGLILIIGGFLSFVSIPITTQHPDLNINFNLLITLGCILIVLGIISMYFFIKTEDKKKKPSSNKPPVDVV